MLPSKQEIQLIESYASLADIVITTHRIEKEIRIAATAFESNEGMLVTNADHIIIKVNQAFTRITGYSAEEAIGQSPDILNSQLNDTAQRSTLWQNINETGFGKVNFGVATSMATNIQNTYLSEPSKMQTGR